MPTDISEKGIDNKHMSFTHGARADCNAGKAMPTDISDKEFDNKHRSFTPGAEAGADCNAGSNAYGYL